MKVALFVTCLVDLFRPSVGFAALKLLEDAGCTVYVPEAQTCCGQPAYNSGARDETKAIARQVIEAFDEFEAVVAPSGSCTGMISHHYPGLFEGDEIWAPRAGALAAKTFELVSFLTDQLGVEAVKAAWPGEVTYHDACSGLRELGIRDQPRKLLASVEGLNLSEAPERDVCCGFGGTFSAKYGEVSGAIVTAKTAALGSTGATTVLGGDLGCLVNIAGRLQREGSPISVRHIAEVLAGMTDTPAIGAADTEAGS
jgi:L-lactate dehydrogenase complex protein LldE